MQPLDQALRDVRDFLRRTAEHVSTDFARRSSDASWWSYAGEGTLFLEVEEAQQYRRSVHAILDVVAQKQLIGVRAVEEALQRAVFAAVDIRKRRSADVDVRCDEAVRELRAYLTRPPQRFRVVMRVNGLLEDDLPQAVGRVEFAKFEESELTYFREAITRHDVPDDERQRRIQYAEKWKQSQELSASTVAVVAVDALEWDAAEDRALREVRLALDVINFFSDLLPYNDAHLSLPADGQTVRTLVLQLRRDAGGWGSFHARHRREGGTGKLSIAQLRDYDARKPLGFAHVCELLGRDRNKLQDRLIASVQWAGRATVDVRREEAFLLYMIALESFVMSGGDRGELSYRFKLRVARLLGSDVTARRRLVAKLTDLYEIRSRIVHSGSYEVTDADLTSMRVLCKTCLVHACTSDEITSMTDPKQLGAWFDDRILG